MPRLVVHNGSKQTEFELLSDNYTIGRESGNDLNLEDDQVSHIHAALTRDGNRWVLHDLGSSNHTWVNDKPIDSWKLTHGDRFRVGQTTIEFQESKAPNLSQMEEPSGLQKQTIVRSAAEIAQAMLRPIPRVSIKAQRIAGSLEQIHRIKKPSAASKDEMLGILFQVSKALSETTGLDAMLETTMKLVFDVIGADRGGIFLGTDPDRLEPRIGWSRKRGGKIATEKVKVSRTVLRQVVGNEVSVIAQDAAHDPRFVGRQSIATMAIRSILCVPLWEPSGTTGAIYLDNKAYDSAFSSDDLELLTAIANLVAIRVRQDELERKLKKEEMLRANLSRYHSPDVVEMLIAQGGNVGLEVEEREVTVLFADVAGSTMMAERLGPAGTADLLSDFFHMATDAVFRHGGSVNKFIGDEVMALYNAPLDQSDHAAQAVSTAVELMTAVREHNRKDPDRSFSLHLGINTGPVVSGNVGTATRMEYTVLGDTVNVAARLCKVLPNDRIAVGEETFIQARGRVDFQFKEMGSIPIKGRRKPIRCCEVLFQEGHGTTPAGPAGGPGKTAGQY